MTGLAVLIAPDCYGDSLTAVQAAGAIADGWRQARGEDRLTLAPQSDGGPGFVDVLASRLGGVRTATVSGPLDTRVTARWVLPGQSADPVCAEAGGLPVLGGPPTVRPAIAAHSG